MWWFRKYLEGKTKIIHEKDQLKNKAKYALKSNLGNLILNKSDDKFSSFKEGLNASVVDKEDEEKEND